MSHNAESVSPPSMNPVALSSYSVAACSFAASILGLGFSHWPSAGLVSVGGFYLIVGLLNRTSLKSAVTEVPTQEISRQTSGADNLVAEAVGGTREQTSPALRNRELVGSPR